MEPYKAMYKATNSYFIMAFCDIVITSNMITAVLIREIFRRRLLFPHSDRF